MDINNLGNESMPSILKDPFKKSKVDSISVTVSRDIFNKENLSAYGIVRFSNGDTKGQQEFRSKSFDGVVLLIKSFLETLE